MATHLGRNPFGKKPIQTSTPIPKSPQQHEKVKESDKSLGEWLLVDLPVETVMLTLKSALLVKSLFDKDSGRSLKK